MHAMVSQSSPKMYFGLGAKITAYMTRGDKTYVATATGAIYILDYEAGYFESPILLHTGPVPALAFTSQGVLVSGGWDRKLIIHQAGSPLEIAVFADAVKSLLCAFGSIYVGSADGLTYRFSENGDLLFRREHNKRFIETMCVIGQYIATAGSDRTIRILRSDTLDLVYKFEFINNIRQIQFSYGYLFVSCAEKLFRVFELPDAITGATLGLKDITLVSETKLPEWGNGFAMLDDFKQSGIYIGCADKTLKRLRGGYVETVASGATDNVLTVEIAKQHIRMAGKERDCYVLIYGGCDTFLRRIFINECDRQFFLADAQEKEVDLEASDFEDEEVKRMQEARFREMINGKK